MDPFIEAMTPPATGDNDIANEIRQQANINLNVAGLNTSDELGAKYDLAAKLKLNPALVAAADNGQLSKLSDPRPELESETALFLAGDPLRAGVYRQPEQLDRLNQAARDGLPFRVVSWPSSQVEADVRRNVYGDAYRPDNPQYQRDLLKAGYVPSPDDMVSYVNPNYPGEKFLQPVVPDWTKSNTERKLDGFWDHLAALSQLGPDVAYAPGSDAAAKKADIQAALTEQEKVYQSTLRKFKVISYLDRTDSAWRQNWDTNPQEYNRAAIDAAGQEAGEDFSDLVPADFSKKTLKDLQMPHMALWALDKLDRMERRMDETNYGASAADIRDTTLRLNQLFADAVGSSTSKEVAQGIADSLPYMAEFAMSDGLAALGKTAVTATVGKPGFWHKLVGALTGEATRLPAFSGNIAEGVQSEFNVPTLTPEQNGDFRLALQDNGLSLGEAVVKHTVETYLMNAAMGSGEALGLTTAKATGLIPKAYKEKVGQAFAAYAVEHPKIAAGIASAQALSGDLQGAAKFDGFFGNMAKMELAHFLNYGATQVGEMTDIKALSSIGTDAPLMSWHERGITAATVAAQSMGFNIPNTAYTLASLRRMARQRDAILAIHDQLHPNNQPAESVTMAQDFLNHALGPDAKITLGAKEAQVLFQQQPELVSDLALTDGELEKLNQRAADNGDIELPLSRVTSKVADKERFTQLLDLARNRPGGITLNEFNPEQAADDLVPKPEDIQRLEQTVNDDREYATALENWAAPLKDSTLSRKEQKAGIALTDNLIRTFAGRSGMSPLDLLNQVKVRNIKYDDFMREQPGDVPFQAVGDLFSQIRTALPEENGTVPLFTKKYRAVSEILPELGRMFNDFPDQVVAADGKNILVKNPENNSLTERFLHLIKSEDPHNKSRNEYQLEKIKWLPRVPETLTLAQAKLEDPQNGNYAYVRSYGDGGIHVVIVTPDGKIVGQHSYDHGLITQFVDKYASRRNGFKVIWEREASSGQSSSGTATAGSLSGDAASLSDVAKSIPPSLKNVKPLFQSVESTKKGAYDPVTGVISLFESADFSTLSHETMHFFDDLYHRLSGQIDDPQLLADIRAIDDYKQNDPERLPKAFENYLRKGEAPTPVLRQLFRTIKDIMLKIYAAIRKDYFADAPVTNEIKAVFDRMLMSDRQSVNEMTGNEALKMLETADLQGLTSADRKAAADHIDARKQQVADDIDAEKARRYEKVRAAAGREAETVMRGIPVYRLWNHLTTAGRLDRDTVKALYGQDTVNALRARGAIARKPRAERSGETFNDVQNRHDVAVKTKEFGAAFDEWLYQTDPLAWAIRGNNYGKIKPDAKFGVRDGEYGSFMDKNGGMASDVAARELADMLNDSTISEESLVEHLRNRRLGDLWTQFYQMRRDEKEYYEKLAQDDLKLDANTNVTELAVEHGYNSADAMVKDLLDNPNPTQFKRMYLEQRLRELEDNFPTSEYALNSKSLLAEMDNLLAALRSKIGKPEAKADQAAYRQVIADRVDKMRVSDVGRSDLTLGAIRRNSREAMQAMTKGDYNAAWQPALTARMQLALVQEMHTVQREMADTLRQTNKLVKYKPESGGKSRVQGDCLHWVQQLALEYGITQRSPAVESSFHELQSLLDHFDCDFSADDLPRNRNTFGEPVTYRDLTVEDFRALSDVLQFLNQAGRNIVKQAETDRAGTTAANIKAMTDTLNTLPKVPQKKETFREWAELEYHDLKLLNKNIRNLCVEADGSVNALQEHESGTAERVFYDRLSACDTREKGLITQVMKEAEPHLNYLEQRRKEFPERITDRMPSVPKEIQEHRQSYWDFNMLLSVALNCGNADNRKKLSQGYADLPPEAIDQLLAKFDRKEDWQAIQGIWDAWDKVLRPAYADVFKQANYVNLKEIPATPFTVKLADGSELPVRGGYYHLVYDGRIDPVTAAKEQAELNMQRSGVAVVRSPDGGLGKERQAQTGKPVLLDFNAWYRSTYESAHYSAYKMAARELGAIMNNRQWLDAWKTVFGDDGLDTMKKLVGNCVNPRRAEMDKWETMLHGITVSTGLWGNVGSAAMQHASFTQGITTVGLDRFIAAQKEFMSAPMQTFREINRMSIFMKDRQKGADRDIRYALNKITDKAWRRRWNDVREFGFIGIRVMDSVASCPVWLAMYRKKLDEGGSRNDAIAAADKLIALTQGSGRNVDMTAIQLKPFIKYCAMFFSAVSAYGNRHGSAYTAFRRGQITPTQYAYFLMMETVAPAIYSGMLRAISGGALAFLGSDDDKKKQIGWATLVNEAAGFPVQGIPIIRDVVPDTLAYLATGHDLNAGKGAQTDLLRPAELIINNGALSAMREDDTDKRSDKWLKAASNIAEAASATTGVPVVTAFKRIKKAYKRYAGDEDAK